MAGLHDVAEADSTAMAGQAPALLLTREGAKGDILVATLNRPATLNALDWHLLQGLDQALGLVAADATIRCLLVEAAGDRAFSAGADLRVAAELTPESAAEWIRLGHRVFNGLVGCRVPVIVALHGYVLGGGLELALACDLRLAANTAQVGLPELTRGWLPGWGGVRRLTALVGPARARAVLLLGNRLSAEEALTAGLIHRVVAPETLAPTARALAARLAALAPDALVAAKAQLTPPGLVIDDRAVEEDARLFSRVVTQPAFRREVEAFLSRKKG